MARRCTRPSEEEIEEPLINLTPLIDVVFVILIAFMLIAPLLDVESIPLARGGPHSTPVGPHAPPLTVSIRSDRSIWYRGQPISLPELALLAQRERASHPHQIPRVAPATGAPFGVYQEVKTLLEAAGFEQMDILLSTQPH